MEEFPYSGELILQEILSSPSKSLFLSQTLFLSFLSYVEFICIFVYNVGWLKVYAYLSTKLD